MVPVRAQPYQLTVQLYADTPAHAHHHRLAVHRLQPLLEVFDDVPGDDLQALLGADDSLKLRPLGLELLLALDLLALGGVLEVQVDLRSLGFVERELGEAAFVVDVHRGAVLHGRWMS